MSDLDTSSNSSSSEDGENVDDSSDSESNSSSDSDQESLKTDSQSWVLSKTNPQANTCDTLNDSGENSSVSDIETSKQNDVRKTPKEDLRSLWESNPQIYGVRRSSRARKEPERLTAFQESDESGSIRRVRNKSKQEDYSGTLTDSGSDEDSESEFKSSIYHRRKGRAKSNQRNCRPSKLSQMRARLEGKKKVSGTRTKRSKGRNASELSDETSSDGDEGRPKRTSSRVQNSKISYKEESQDETDSDDVVEVVEKVEDTINSECIDRVMDDRIGKPEAVGGSTTWYAIKANGDPNAGFDPDADQGIQQYLIFWKGWSHLHNTWESEKSLREQNVRGIKKLENYIRKKDELDAWLKLASPEDAEYFLCQQELGRDLVKTYRKVERIIAKSRQKNRSGFWDYQVKWNGLPYGECTWEDGELIKQYFPEAIDKFEFRQENQRVPKKDAKKRTPSKFIPIKSTPTWLNGEKSCSLRDYQVDGVNWLANSWYRNNSVILADEMGLGKTIQSITFLSYLYHIHGVDGPFLIIVPLSTIAAWQREFHMWADFMNIIVYVGDASSRTLIRDVEWTFPNKKLKFNVVLTTYEILLKEKAFLGSHTWAVIAVDEAHRLKNDDSLLYRSLMEFKSHHRLLITGTPLQNSLKELWSLLHFIMPERFHSWPEFEERHSNERETGYTSLHKILQPFLLRRVKKDVEKSLPAKVERILRVEMSSVQKQYYRWILTKNYRELSKGNKGKVSSFCNIVMELKKCCNHAFLTKPNDKVPLNNEERLQTLIRSSGKMILLDKLLKRLKEGGHRVLIFSQMVRMLDLLQQYLILNRIGFQRLDGSIKGELRRQALERFNAPGSEDFCFLLSTRAGGLGINLASADTVIIFDSDWNPQNDLQAQARAHRIGQTNQVNIYRLVCVSSVEEDIIERAKRKMVLDHLVIQRMDTSGKTVLSKNSAPSASTGNPFNKEELSAILKFGAEDLFKEVDGEDNEPECDIDEILRRAETTEEQAESEAGDELLSAFKFATFTFDEDEEATTSSVKNEEDSRDDLKDWDDIIPESDRKLIEEEERKKQEAELYLPPRNRKSLKIGGGSDSDVGSDDSEDSEEEGEENDTSTKKRGRSARSQKDAFPGFTTAEVRKFVKSFRKFGNPLERLDAIARDAELTVQSEADLRRLGEQLNIQLRETLQVYNKQLVNATEDNLPSQTSKRGPSFRIGGASVSVKTTMACMEELEPLVDVMPKDPKEREKFRLAIPVKPIRGWDCVWTSEDDSNLLIGVYEYGMGSWEQLQSDVALGLEKKILRPNKEKPQAKQLQTRVEYLMKLLRKTKELGRAPTVTSATSNSALTAAATRVARNIRQGNKSDRSPGKQDDPTSKKRSRKIKSKARVEPLDDSDVEVPVPLAESEDAEKHMKSQKNSKHVPNSEEISTVDVKGSKKTGKEKSRKMKRKQKLKDEPASGNHVPEKKKLKSDRKNVKGPVHISIASDPVPIGQDDFSGKLDSKAFDGCKERMRPVRKALKLLDKPSPDGSKEGKAHHEHMKKCILEIGDRVLQCLKEFNDPNIIQNWRRNLWIFVSQFTECNAQALYKMYKKASKKREEQKRKIKKKNPAAGDAMKSNTLSPTSSTTQKKESAPQVKHSVGKKRPHSPSRSLGAGDAPKRLHNSADDHQRDRSSHHHQRKIDTGLHDRVDERSNRESSSHHSRYHHGPTGYTREMQREGQRFVVDNNRYGHGNPSHYSWSRRDEEQRCREEYRRREYERYAYETHMNLSRDDSRYLGCHRSPYSERGHPHGEDMRRYQSNSNRPSPPYHAGRSPVHAHYSNSGRHPHQRMQSPSSSRQRSSSPSKDLFKRETVT